VLELSELEPLMVDHGTVISALYGDMQVTLRSTAEGVKLDPSVSHRRNGFFANTSRVSAVVVQKTKVGESVEVTREVFPTNNSEAMLLTRAELERFGTVVADLAHLCRR
jgi:hypothetical protein